MLLFVDVYFFKNIIRNLINSFFLGGAPVFIFSLIKLKYFVELKCQNFLSRIMYSFKVLWH